MLILNWQALGAELGAITTREGGAISKDRSSKVWMVGWAAAQTSQKG